MSLIRVSVDDLQLEGVLEVPKTARGIVLFAHGSGSSRLSPRNTYVAEALREAGMGTLLIDLLSAVEDRDYHRRFDIELLTHRLAAAARWLRSETRGQANALGLFGASTGAAAALRVAAAMGSAVRAVVSRGGRPDLASVAALRAVTAPTLLIVGGLDYGVIELNRDAYVDLHCPKKLEIVPGATHLFEEPGTLEQVAQLAGNWFGDHFSAKQEEM